MFHFITARWRKHLLDSIVIQFIVDRIVAYRSLVCLSLYYHSLWCFLNEKLKQIFKKNINRDLDN